MERRAGAACCIALTSVFLGGCERNDSSKDSADLRDITYVGCEGFNSDTVGCSETQCPVTLSLSDKFQQNVTVFSQGEAVAISGTIVNNTEQTRCFPFSSSQQYDFWVKAMDGTELWRWSANKIFAQAVTAFTLLPGESKSFETGWGQMTNDGQPLPVGTYTMGGDIWRSTLMVEFEIE